MRSLKCDDNTPCSISTDGHNSEHALKAPQSLNTKEITFLFKNSSGYYYTNQSGY